MAAKYRAIRACWHNGHFYKIGASYKPPIEELRDPKKLPRHFIKEEEFSDDKVEAAAKEDITSRKVNVKATKAVV